MAPTTLAISLALESEKSLTIPYSSPTTAEDVCITVCKHLNIGNLAKHIFGLRAHGKYFLRPNQTIPQKLTNIEFRIRFKVANLARLKKLDGNAYNYYFHQARLDVLESKVPDIVYERHRGNVLGLSISDMFRVVMEKGISREVVERDYKKYVPKGLLRKHPFFIRRPIHNSLVRLENGLRNNPFDVEYLKAQYLIELDAIAPDYLSESYKAVMDIDGRSVSIIIKVTPPHSIEPGIKYCLQSKKEDWSLISTIEELGFVSVRNDGTIEISRLNGIPIYLKFLSILAMWSFVSLLDGYYRLTCKWTFNLCQELVSPSSKKLHSMKCHGPVGGEFSYAKLEAKTNNQAGCFIIRESESTYNTYYVDVCIKDRLGSKPKTFKLNQISDGEFLFHDDIKTYSSIIEIVQAYSDPEGAIYLKECIPPSEYDESPLLLCKTESVVGDALTDSSSLQQLISDNPVCINYKDLQVYKGQRKDGFRKITHVYRGMWKVTPGKKIEVALKFLNHDQEKHLKSYLNLMGQWAFLKASTIVRIFGMTFSNDVSLVTEYFKLGPLDQYLRANPSVVKPVDLIEAASNLASAVWHLKENNIVHGRIRCRKLMVHCHDDSCFNVKLTDNAVHTPYEPSEVHWIPIECYSTNKRTSAADVWALATTIYEIFSYGKEFEPADQMKLMRFYMSGKRLAQPAACPDEIYTLMTECWNEDQQKRKQPQAISRDINHLLYQVYNSRKKHAYDMLTRSSEMSSRSITSFMTDSSDCIDLYSSDDLVESATIRCESSLSNASSQQCLLPSNLNNFSSGDIDNTDSWSHLLSTTTSTFLDRDDLNWLQGIFDLDDNYEVVLKGRIGEGNYGEVYRGSLQSKSNEPTEPTLVAVKKLKASLSNTEQDFEREISIMKALKHPNIVRILGVLREPDLALVMEFVHGGCLQSSLRHEKEKFETGRLLKYASDIAMGMDYLGKKNIVHRDLAARNILVVDENHVKISDFGLAQFMDGKDYYTLRSFNRELPVKWYAPESLSEGKFSVKSDVWSYGVTLYEMFNYGESPPVLGNIDSMPEGQEVGTLIEEMTKAIGKGDRYPCPEHCPQVVYVRLMRPCWEAKPQDRPTFKDIVGELGQLMQSY